MRQGVPYALGMQFNLPDISATPISRLLYTYLAAGHSLQEAVRQSRIAAKRQHLLLVGLLALYVADLGYRPAIHL